MSKYTDAECEKYRNDPSKNPKTDRKLQKGKKLDLELQKECTPRPSSTKVSRTPSTKTRPSSAKVSRSPSPKTKIPKPSSTKARPSSPKPSSQKLYELSVEDYTDKSLVIRGDTKPWKVNLSKLGAKFNPRLKNGAGWIISKTKQSAINKFVEDVNAGLIEPAEEIKTQSASGLSVEDYTDKSLVIRGDTKPWKEALKTLKARYNLNLNGEPGWIISKKHSDAIKQFVRDVNEGNIEPTEEVKIKSVPRKVQSKKGLKTSNSEPQKKYITDSINLLMTFDNELHMKFVVGKIKELLRADLEDAIYKKDIDRVKALAKYGVANLQSGSLATLFTNVLYTSKEVYNKDIIKILLESNKSKKDLQDLLDAMKKKNPKYLENLKKIIEDLPSVKKMINN